MIYRFDKLFKWQSGKPIKESEGSIPIYGSNGIIGYTDKPKYNNRIIIGRVGAYCGSVEYCKSDFNATDNTLITECNEDIIIYDYAYYLLKTYGLNRYAGGAAQPLITQGILKHLKCEIPDVETQKKISKVLSEYDEMINVNNKRIIELENISEKMYQKLFAFHKIIDKSKEVRIMDIMDFQRGISYSSDDINVEDGINLINLKNINAYGGFRRDGTKLFNGKYKKTQVVKKGDLVMGVTDMTQDRRTVGSVALIPSIKGECVISADLVKVVSDIDNYFLYAMFKYGNLSKNVSQFANGANVLHLKPQAIAKVKIQLPDQELIKKYVKFIGPIIMEIDNLNMQNDLLISQRDLLIPRLLSGKNKV